MTYFPYKEEKAFDNVPAPYYMAFPLQDDLQRDEENYRDLLYIKQMYPKRMQKIQQQIEKECDQLEYDGSMMFDEFPDQVLFRSLCSKIYDTVKDIEADEICETCEIKEVNMTQRGPGPWPPPPPPGRPGPWPPPPPPGGPGPVIPQRPNPTNWMRDIIQTLLYNEMYNRRCRYRDSRCRRWKTQF